MYVFTHAALETTMHGSLCSSLLRLSSHLSRSFIRLSFPRSSLLWEHSMNTSLSNPSRLHYLILRSFAYCDNRHQTLLPTQWCRQLRWLGSESNCGNFFLSHTLEGMSQHAIHLHPDLLRARYAKSRGQSFVEQLLPPPVFSDRCRRFHNSA